MTNRASPHPFQGGIPYPWDRPVAQALYEALSRDLTLPGQIDILARTYAPAAPALNLNQSPAELWRLALTSIALADRLLALCEYLVGQAALVAVAAAAQAVLDARAAVERRLGPDNPRQLTIRLVQQLGQSIDRFNRLFGPIRPDAGWSAPRLDIETTELQSLLARLAGELQEAKGAVGASSRPIDLPEFVDKAEEALQLQQRFQTSLAVLVSPVSSTSNRISELRRFRPLGERLAEALEDLRHSMAEEIVPSRRATQG